MLIVYVCDLDLPSTIMRPNPITQNIYCPSINAIINIIPITTVPTIHEISFSISHGMRNFLLF